MITDTHSPRATTAALSSHEATSESYVDWAAILAGGILALAMGAVLISFGAGLGLSLTSPYGGEGVSASWLAIAAGIWFAWVMVTSFGAGGYLTGRMRRRAGDATAPEVEVRDGAHGLIVWATGALVGTVLATFGATGLISVGVAAVGSATELVADAAESDYFANIMLRGADTAEPTDAPAQSAPTDDAATPTDADGAPDQPVDTAPAVAPSTTATAEEMVDPAVQQQVAAVLARSATNGEMVERDRSYLADVVAANTGLGPDEARTRVDEVNAEIEAARAEALEAAEQARVAGVVFGFIAAATLLLGAIAAMFAAAAGGRHRDAGLGFDVFTEGR